MGIESQAPEIDRTTVTPLVRQVLRSEAVEIVDWHTTPLNFQGGGSTWRSVYRVAGTGLDSGKVVTWSLILKVLRGRLHAVSLGNEETQWAYWKREALVYRAGLLDDLPDGLAAPRCFGVVEYPSEVLWIWLEELVDTMGAPWPLVRYGLAARHLGGFNGAYLAGRPMPAYPWLSRDWLRSRTASVAKGMPFLQCSSTWEHPLVRRAFPPPVVGRLLRLFEERETFLWALARLPQTHCHFDAWHGNLFAGRAPDGREQTVAIDWAFVGPGAVGEEISLLVWASLQDFKIELADAARLEESVLQNYLEGLHEAGWRGDPRLVRFGYIVNAALQWGIFPEYLSDALDESRHAALEQSLGLPIEAIVERSAAVTSLLLERAAEARKWLGDL
jgi:hypothetical protein